MQTEFKGIERRLDELEDRLARLAPLKDRARSEFDEDAYLRDIAERNLEVSAQCCIDICHRVISLTGAKKPRDYYEAFIRAGEIGLAPMDFMKKIAPLSGFRNILVHEYLSVNWDEVFRNLQNIDQLKAFADHVRAWLKGAAHQVAG